MNLLKKMTLGLLAAVAVPSMASAQTVIHITGSTAFRAPVTCALVSQLGGIGTASNSCRALWTGSSTFLKGTSSIIANGTLGSGGTATIVVEANWTGSLAGVVDVATQNPLAFPDETNATNISAINASTALVTANYTGGSTGYVSAGFGGRSITLAPDIAMSDAFVSSCAKALATATITGSITGGATTGAALAAQINAAGLQEAGNGSSVIVGAGTASGYLGIVPFEWVIGNLNGSAAVPTNITQQTASYLIANGGAPLSLFSSSGTDAASTDTTEFVYLVGRNEDSGTRIDAFAEPQTGFQANPTQYNLTFSGGSTTSALPTPSDYTQTGGTAALVETANPWTSGSTLNTETKITWNLAGHGGYASGGDLDSVLTTPVDQSNISGTFAGQNSGNIYFIGYLGVSDAGIFGSVGQPTNGTHVLSYNGVYAGVNSIQDGSYSFWSYEHMYYLSSIGAKKSFADSVANVLASTYVSYGSGGTVSSAPGGVALLAAGSPGAVKRSVEGGVYTLNY